MTIKITIIMTRNYCAYWYLLRFNSDYVHEIWWNLKNKLKLARWCPELTLVGVETSVPTFGS